MNSNSISPPEYEKHIVKVQTAAGSSMSRGTQVLIYRKGRLDLWQGQDANVWALLGGPVMKGYYHAEFVPQPGGLFKWKILSPAPAQDW